MAAHAAGFQTPEARSIVCWLLVFDVRVCACFKSIFQKINFPMQIGMSGRGWSLRVYHFPPLFLSNAAGFARMAAKTGARPAGYIIKNIMLAKITWRLCFFLAFSKKTC